MEQTPLAKQRLKTTTRPSGEYAGNRFATPGAVCVNRRTSVPSRRIV
jgi:hypothetical protein